MLCVSPYLQLGGEGQAQRQPRASPASPGLLERDAGGLSGRMRVPVLCGRLVACLTPCPMGVVDRGLGAG